MKKTLKKKKNGSKVSTYKTQMEANPPNKTNEQHLILHLQETIGNQAAQTLIQQRGIRTKAEKNQRYFQPPFGPSTGLRAGGDAPIPLRPLTEEDRMVEMQADRFKNDSDLQNAFDNKRPIRLFDKGPAVEKLQQAFLDLGFSMPKSTKENGEPDGIFGNETYLVVRGFQWRQGVVVDGIAGRQTLRELDGLFTGQTPPGTTPAGPEEPGTEITVEEEDVEPKQFGKCGGFSWGINWKTNARNGYLVQEIEREFEITKSDGLTPDVPFTPHYWEAWRVQEDGGIHGTSGADDDWKNGSQDINNPLDGFPGTAGKWKITGKVFFIEQLDLTKGFKVANVPDAGTLWSTFTDPGDMGPELLLRKAGGQWDCCGGNSSHVPDD